MASYFVKSRSWCDEIQAMEKEEEKRELKHKLDEEKLFHKVSKYLKNTSSVFGIFTMRKLSELPVSTPVKRLETLAVIICRGVFTTPVKQTKVDDYVQFYKDFAYLKVAQEGKPKQTIGFEEILTRHFINKLTDRFCYAERLYQLVSNRQMPNDKIIKWIVRCNEQQKTYLKQTDIKSINFLCGLHKWNPEIVYKAIELLLKIDRYETVDYMASLLAALNQPNSNQKSFVDCWLDERFDYCSWRQPVYYWETTAKREDLRKLFLNVTKLAKEKLLTQRWASVKTSLKDFLRKRPCKAKKYNYPEDYITIYVENNIGSDEFGRMTDDFEEDSEEETIIFKNNSLDFDFD